MYVLLTRTRPSCRRRGPQWRSVLGLPVLSPNATLIQAWDIVLTFVDLSYTAFIVAISLAFDNIAGGQFTWMTIADLMGSECRAAALAAAALQLGWGQVAAIVGARLLRRAPNAWCCPCTRLMVCPPPPAALAAPSVAGFYVVDILVGFHVGFVVRHDVRRLLVTDGRLVARYYVQHGQFLVNFIACEREGEGELDNGENTGARGAEWGAGACHFVQGQACASGAGEGKMGQCRAVPAEEA